MEKNLLLLLLALSMAISCKKKDSPQPATVKSQSLVETPTPTFKKMTTGKMDASYVIQDLEFVSTDGSKDSYDLKIYNHSNNTLESERTVKVWWVNNVPQSDYFVFAAQGSGWEYSYTETQNDRLIY